MYSIIKNVIWTGRFELSDLCRKIDTVWLQGQITEAQHSELLDMARKNADPAMSVDLLRQFTALEQRVSALENGHSDISGNYPEYVPGKIYHTGNNVTFRGSRYRCTAPDGMVCPWSPGEYPAYWELIPE